MCRRNSLGDKRLAAGLRGTTDVAPAALGAGISIEDVFPFKVLKLRHAEVDGPFAFHGLKRFQGDGLKDYFTIKRLEEDIKCGGKNVQMFGPWNIYREDEDQRVMNPPRPVGDGDQRIFRYPCTDQITGYCRCHNGPAGGLALGRKGETFDAEMEGHKAEDQKHDKSCLKAYFKSRRSNDITPDRCPYHRRHNQNRRNIEN